MAASAYVSPVQLFVSCKGLLNKDVTSKSDPLVAVLLHDRRDAHRPWKEAGRTECLKNTLEPKFATPIQLNYLFEEVQKLDFRVYDLDNETAGLDDDDFLGSTETSLGQLVSNGSTTLPLKYKKKEGKNVGTITIVAEVVARSNELLTLYFYARNLDKKDFLSKSDPYLELLRTVADGSTLVVHRTEVVKNNLNPTWRPFTLPVQKLSGGNEDNKIKVNCFDYDNDGSHDFIGEFVTTVRELKEAAKKQLSWDCINPKKKAKKKSYKNSGVIHLSRIEVEQLHTFLDFVTAGCQINFTVGIDFTGSNGDPRQPTSLHYINPYEPNEYTKALIAVGEICQQYDTDKLFPAFGFGAKVPPGNAVSHEFPLNGNPTNPYCQGIAGVVGAYQASLQRTTLWGPTNAAPIINHVARFARESAKSGVSNNYFILLLLTDGVLSDMADTKKAVVEASDLPMSIIIVGVGNADFSDMETLDADKHRLQYGTKVAARDIVQFVPFRNYREASPADLARDVLAEVPSQVVEHFRLKRLPPMQSGEQPPK
ncbi:copine-3-like [Oscarella lobularis]|uniref:copine-3-like n=1 Tax=Oscarella lobularis TaxID=121494 RepID=UPI0033135EDE